MNLYQLNQEATGFLKSKFRWYETSAEINRAFHNDFLPKILKTSTGKNKYPKYYEKALNQVFISVTSLLRDEYTIFGYWYDGVFYTTYKNTEYKTTEDLRRSGYSPRYWDTLESGFYYKDNLKLYF